MFSINKWVLLLFLSLRRYFCFSFFCKIEWSNVLSEWRINQAHDVRITGFERLTSQDYVKHTYNGSSLRPPRPHMAHHGELHRCVELRFPTQGTPPTCSLCCSAPLPALTASSAAALSSCLPRPPSLAAARPRPPSRRAPPPFFSPLLVAPRRCFLLVLRPWHLGEEDDEGVSTNGGEVCYQGSGVCYH
jgi:hypothetical protein